MTWTTKWTCSCGAFVEYEAHETKMVKPITDARDSDAEQHAARCKGFGFITLDSVRGRPD